MESKDIIILAIVLQPCGFAYSGYISFGAFLGIRQMCFITDIFPKDIAEIEIVTL